jgi:hypothetical protein
MHVRADFLGCGCTIERTWARLAKVAFGYSYRLAHSLRRAEKTPIAERNRYGRLGRRDTAYLRRSGVSQSRLGFRSGWLDRF